MVQVKAAKAKTNKKSGAKTSKLTISATLAGLTKKISIKGEYDLNASGEQTFATKGQSIALQLGANGMTGRFGKYRIEGVPNVNASDGYVGAYNLIADEGSFTVTVAKKGKVKVAGTTAAGKKVSVSTQLLAGDGVACVPVIAPKAELAFTVWFGEKIEVDGLANAAIGNPGTLAAGATFRFDAGDLAALVGDATYAAYFPDGLEVMQAGTKWVVAPDGNGKASKAGKVVLGKDGAVDAAKLGGNPSALKLTYTAKTGAFKGSFKAYVNNKGKPKAVTVNVAGVMVGGVGHGTATVKGAGSVPVTIE